MNRFTFLLLFGILAILLVSCSQPSMEDDARRAAELSIESNTSAMENDLRAAGKLYEQSQKIMNKYRQNGKFDEFYELYINCLQENAYLEDQEAVSNMPASDVASTNQ